MWAGLWVSYALGMLALVMLAGLERVKNNPELIGLALYALALALLIFWAAGGEQPHPHDAL